MSAQVPLHATAVKQHMHCAKFRMKNHQAFLDTVALSQSKKRVVSLVNARSYECTYRDG